jgi:large subunit ribosomal protein L30
MPTEKKASKKASKKKSQPATLRIQQVKSPIGYHHKQREVLRSLGLRRIRQVVEREDTPAVRGMVAKITHLVAIVEDEP